MKLNQLLEGVTSLSVDGSSEINIQGITDDSRKVKEGYLFVAVKGLTVDGHEFIDKALEKGAIAVVTEKHSENRVKATLISVSDSREALGKIASNFYLNPSQKLKVIGVTGTKGKTTTCFFIYQMLTALGKKTGLVTSISAKIGTKEYDTGFHVTNPDTISLNGFLKDMVDEGCGYAVIEVSSHGIDQKRIAGIKFDIGVLTNIAPEHLDYHKTFEIYRDVKLSFLKGAKNVILNVDEENFNYLQKNLNENKLFTYSLNADSDINLKNVPNANTIEGEFNWSNLLAASAAINASGIELSKIRKVISSVSLPEGRLEEVSNDLGIKIVIDFAHTPDSLFNALTHLKKITKGRLIAVFGSAGERDPFKRPKMGKIASQIADVVVLTSEDPRSESVYDIISQIKNGISENDLSKVKDIPDRSEAIKFALKLARSGDVIGFFGKGHEKSMNLDGISEVPWSDRDEIYKYLNDK